MKTNIFSNQGRTSVTVSHRLPSIVTSDMIYVIQKGQVSIAFKLLKKILCLKDKRQKTKDMIYIIQKGQVSTFKLLKEINALKRWLSVESM